MRVIETAVVGGQSGRSASVRRFRTDHIPDVVRLRRLLLRGTERPDDGMLAEHYARVFFGNPWRDQSMPSLVVEQGGRLVGFLGVIPRPLVFKGETIRAAASTEFLVHPDHHGTAALQLLQSYLRLGQDISFADRANDRARILFEASGGFVAPWWSSYWAIPLRPLRHALAQVDAGGALRPALALARRLAAAADRFRSVSEPARADRIEPLAPDAVAGALARVLGGRCDLLPRYDRLSLAWLLECVAEKASYGVADAFQLRDRGELVGWCAMLVQAGARAEVVHWAAARGWHRAVFESAAARAAARGAITFAGRLDPFFAPLLAEERAAFTLAQPWVLVHSRRADLRQAVAEGRGFFSRLDGEWWLST